MIERVKDVKVADMCDDLLTKLILDEKQYDYSIDEKGVVKDYFRNVIKEGSNILLSKTINNKAIGYIYLKPIKNSNNKGYLIDGLYVEKEYRNKGNAKELIKAALSILSSYDIDFIDINVMYNNTIAKKIYKYLGFNEFRVQMRKKVK